MNAQSSQFNQLNVFFSEILYTKKVFFTMIQICDIFEFLKKWSF